VHFDPDTYGTWSGETFSPTAFEGEADGCKFEGNPYTAKYVLPTLPQGTFEHREQPCGPCPQRLKCPLVKCARDFGGFVVSDSTGASMMNANLGVINRLTIGTSLQFDRACEPILGGTPPAIFPLPMPIGMPNPCNGPQVSDNEFIQEVDYTLNAVNQRLQNVGILANYTASKGHSVFRSIGHSTDDKGQEFPQSNRELFTAIGNATKKCYRTPRIYLSDIYLYVTDLTECLNMAENGEKKVLQAQISCLNNLLGNWAATFGPNTDSIDQHRFIQWYEENCYSCC
jgi:hypothetical protein